MRAMSLHTARFSRLPRPGGLRLILLLCVGVILAWPVALTLHALGVDVSLTVFLAMALPALPPLVYLLASPSMRHHERRPIANAVRRRGSANLILFGFMIAGGALLLSWQGASVVLNVTGFYLGLVVISIGFWTRYPARTGPDDSRPSVR